MFLEPLKSKFRCLTFFASSALLISPSTCTRRFSDRFWIKISFLDLCHSPNSLPCDYIAFLSDGLGRLLFTLYCIKIEVKVFDKAKNFGVLFVKSASYDRTKIIKDHKHPNPMVPDTSFFSTSNVSWAHSSSSHI